MRKLAVALCLLVAVSHCGIAVAARPRRPSAAQTKKMQEQVAFMQLEMIRYQSQMAAKQQEIYKSFDEDGDGRLAGGEKARYDKHMHAIQAGREPNPFMGIAPVGQGPRPKSPLSDLKEKAAGYNQAVLAKQREIFSSFDEDGDGQLTGGEKARFDKHMHAIQTSAVPNPFVAAGSDAAAAGAAAIGKR